MTRGILVIFGAILCLAADVRAQVATPAPDALSPAAREVWNTEVAFARTMADRNHEGFVSFLSEEAIFIGQTALRGRTQVAAGWKRFYEGPQAPFSWGPDRVEVLDSGTLGLSSGPVFNPEGKRTGTFMSVWRKEADGKWRIIFDRGCPTI